MTEYWPTPAVVQQLARSFTYHAPTPDQVERYPLIRESGKAFAELVVRFCPPSREQALALTKIEEAIMWANAGIARNEGD